MKVNVGGIDRILRIAAGALLIVLAALSVIGPWGYIGIVPLLTGLFRVPGLQPPRHEHLPDQVGARLGPLGLLAGSGNAAGSRVPPPGGANAPP